MSIREMNDAQIKIFTKVIADLIDKEQEDKKYEIKRNDLINQKHLLREEWLEIKEIENTKEYEKKKNQYFLKTEKIETKLLINQMEEKSKELKTDRLELVYSILTRTDLNLNNLYQELLEKIKDEVVFKLEMKLKICRGKLIINSKENSLTPNEEESIRSELYTLKTNITKIKSVLKINKLAQIKELNIRELIVDEIEPTFEKLYPESLEINKTKYI